MRRDRLTADNAAALLIDQRTRSPAGVPGYTTAVTSLVKLAKIITAALVMVAGILTAAGPAAAGENPVDFIRTVGNQVILFFFSSRSRHTRSTGDCSSVVCSSDLNSPIGAENKTGYVG